MDTKVTYRFLYSMILPNDVDNINAQGQVSHQGFLQLPPSCESHPSALSLSFPGLTLVVILQPIHHVDYFVGFF